MPIDHHPGLRAIGKALRKELAHEQPPVRPEIERSLRRLLERDLTERPRPRQTWSGWRDRT
jgi:hypothetical protein